MEGGREEDGAAASPPTNTTMTSASPPVAAHAAAAPSEPANAASSPVLTQDHDSDSEAESVDMDVSASDDEQEPEPKPELSEPMPLTNGAESAEGPQQVNDTVTNVAPAGHQDSHVADLAPVANSTTAVAPVQSITPGNAVQRCGEEIWQHIFLYARPAALARCLRVCKKFNHALTDVRGEESRKKPRQKDEYPPSLKLMDHNKIWASARKFWMKNLPKPLARCTELQMLQLIGGLTCQFCLRKLDRVSATSVVESGPGMNHLRVIWPFGIRTCGGCMANKIKTDIQLLKSSAGSLASGLPYIFMTSTYHYVPEIQRQAPGGMSMRPGVQLSKVFYMPDVEQILTEFENAVDLNSGEEWRKGLHDKGKEAMADAARWEKWESQLLRGSDPAQMLREYDPDSFPGYMEDKRRSVNIHHQPPAVIEHGRTLSHALPPNPHIAQQAPFTSMPAAPFSGMYPPSYQPQPEPQHWPAQPSNGPTKNPAVVEERRQARKAEIERRCMELNPPLDPQLLPSMDAFQAAMQIALPMTDQAWEALKPRLLAQKEKAELDAYNRAEQLAALAASVPFSMADNNFLKPAKEIYNEKYDLAQGPLRSRLTGYLDEYVNASWNANPHLDFDSSPVFAAKAILHIHQRYKEDEATGTLPQADAAPKVTDEDNNPLPDPFLSLDNMKWLYEQKIKPYMNHIRPNVFICAGCYEDHPDSSLKMLAFEGLIQHYGAKHTTAFSKGNITVYWQTAEWPEEPPFYPQPEKLLRPPPRKHAPNRRVNAKGTPQPRGEGMFQAPAIENGHVPRRQASYGNGYHGGSQENQRIAYGQSSHLRGHPDNYNAVELISDSDKANQLAGDMREVWDALDGVPESDMLSCIRLHTAVHHATSRFVEKYQMFPSLDLVTDALATNPIMQPIRTATGLACRQCVSSQTDGSASKQSYYGRIKSAKLYNTNSLINHFQITHKPKMPHASWHKDMWELPEMQIIQELPHAQGMDDDKLHLIVPAFPQAFNFQSHVSISDYVSTTSTTGFGPTGVATNKVGNKRKAEPVQSKKKRKRGNANAPNGRVGSQELPYPEPPKDYEYDPRKPMASTEEEDDEAIAAKFDTDVARRKQAASTTAAPSPNPAMNAVSLADLAPETLRALQALGSGVAAPPTQQAPPPARDTRLDRAPSVGRDEYVPSPSASALAQSTSSNATVQPDIAAILASLQGGALPQVVTPTNSAGRGGSSRDASVSRSAHREQGIDQLFRAHQQERSGTSGYPGYAAPPPPMTYYAPTVEPPQTPSPRYEAPGSDLQAALERNSRHFSLNQTQRSTPQQGYGGSPAYASPPEQQRQVQHVAPPRYGYGMDDHHHHQHGQAYAPTPVYGHPPPPQGYASAPVQPPAQGYGQYLPQDGAVVGRRTVYVDEHGREIQLIPVEAAAQFAHAPPPPPLPQYGGAGAAAGGGYYEQQRGSGHGQGYYGAGAGGGR